MTDTSFLHLSLLTNAVSRTDTHTHACRNNTDKTALKDEFKFYSTGMQMKVLKEEG